MEVVVAPLHSSERATTMLAMYLALVVLMLVAIACGSSEPNRGVPRFAAGEAEALVQAMVIARAADISEARVLTLSPECSGLLRTRFQTTTASYSGQGVWSVESGTVDMRSFGTTTLKWKVFEFSGVAVPMNPGARFVMQCRNMIIHS